MMIVNRIPTIHLMTFYCVLHVLELTIFYILQVRNLLYAHSNPYYCDYLLHMACLFVVDMHMQEFGKILNNVVKGMSCWPAG